MMDFIQTFCGEIGESACYALSLIKVAENITGRNYNVIECLDAAITKGYIYYNRKDPNDNDNFYVQQPEQFVKMLTGRKLSVRHDAANPIIETDKEYVIQRWERVQTGITTAHFRLPDWDPVFDSQTVKHGRIVSTRVIRLD